jgi:hypothetical protein
VRAGTEAGKQRSALNKTISTKKERALSVCP